MVKLTKIYTRGGDGGQTSLSDGSRVAKDDGRVAAEGDVDELNAVIGLARQHAEGQMDEMLARIQHDLFDLGADLATPIVADPKYPPLRIVDAQVDRLEQEIDQLGEALATLNSFVLPGGTALAAQARAEGHNGIIYPSVRHPEGICIAALWPNVVQSVTQGTMYRLTWSGSPEFTWEAA